MVGKALGMAATLVALLVGGGCTEPGAAPQASRNPALDNGRVYGHVLDDQRLPIRDASLDLVELGLHTTSDFGGRFDYPTVPPGVHTLRVRAAGFENAQHNVDLKPGLLLELNVLLTPLPAALPYHETFAFNGLQQCSVFTIQATLRCDYPYAAAVGALNQRGVNVTQFGAPDGLVENRNRYNFTVAPNHTGIVSELAWEKNSDASDFYWLTLSCPWYDSVQDACVPPGQAQTSEAYTYAHVRGPSPLRVEWKHPRPDWLPWVMSRAFVSGRTDQYASVALDQRIEMFNTVFYGGDVPVGWRVAAPRTP